ncbi:DUF6113 family protein [Kitasatospora gansuensis]
MIRTLPARVLGSREERLAERQPSRGGRLVAYPVLFVLGALVSLCGCFVQSLWPPPACCWPCWPPWRCSTAACG